MSPDGKNVVIINSSNNTIYELSSAIGFDIANLSLTGSTLSIISE